MSFKDRYGSTQIKSKRRDNLRIGWDCEDDPKDIKQRFPVFLFTPDMENTNDHHHIVLDKKQAKILRDWLDAYLKEQGEKR